MKKIKLISLCACGAALFFSSCYKDNIYPYNNNNEPGYYNGGRPIPPTPKAGFVYTESNEADTNHILIYNQSAQGALTLQGTVASGGTGTGAALGSQGALALANNYRWLFAVNAGNNTISSFLITNGGGLTLAHTVSSGGILPISITVYENALYVLNAGSDSISGFLFGNDGNMTAITGSTQALSATGSSPEQISFSPDGRFVFVTEKAANYIASYAINRYGAAQAGVFTLATGANPYGFAFAQNRFMVVSNAAGGTVNVSSATSYNGANNGYLQNVNGAVADSGTSACWLATTETGNNAYVCNAGSNTISIYAISATNGSLTLRKANAAAGNHPIDIIVTGNDFFVYNLNIGNQTIGEFSRTDSTLTNLGNVTGLPASAGGLVGF